VNESVHQTARRWRDYLGPALLALAAIIVLAGGDAVYMYQLALVGIYAIAAVGQQWLIGRTGQASVGGAAFMGIGAFTATAVAGHAWGVFPLPILAAAVAGGVVGLLLGLTTVRLRGLYLLLSTLALEYIATFVMQEYEGQNGGEFINFPKIGAFTFGQGERYNLLLIVVLLIVVVVVQNLYRSATGRTWSAIRQNEEAAEVAGINVLGWKLIAFVGSSAITAVAGAMYAYQLQSVSYQTFSLDLAISILCMVYLGGQYRISGAILGAAVVTLLQFGLQQLDDTGSGGLSSWLTLNGPTLDTAIYGALLVLIMLFEREGIAQLLANLRDMVAAQVTRFRGESA